MSWPRLLRIREEEVLFASTGVIGKRLPVGAVVAGLPALVARLGGERIEDFARAVMTTDTYPKIAGAAISGAEGWSVEGVAKGAGMINPLFATMLAFVFTDCPLDPLRMGRLLPALGRETFERISVDGDTSTNDTVMLFSTGREGAKAGIDPIREALGRVMKELALLIVKDGEGATKVIHITVKGARQKRIAEAIARRIAVSPLVKTAFFGCDPNWGRIICAAGDALVPLDPEKVEIALQGEMARGRRRRGAFFGREAKEADGRPRDRARRQPPRRRGLLRYVHDRSHLRLHQDQRLVQDMIFS